MAGKRITMRKIRDVIRLRLSTGLSIREISRRTKLRVGGIQKLLTRAAALDLRWPLPEDLNDNQLANLFYPTADTCPWRICVSSCFRQLEQTATMLLPSISIDVYDIVAT